MNMTEFLRAENIMNDILAHKKLFQDLKISNKTGYPVRITVYNSDAAHRGYHDEIITVELPPRLVDILISGIEKELPGFYEQLAAIGIEIDQSVDNPELCNDKTEDKETGDAQ